jgi:hypothetical protein
LPGVSFSDHPERANSFFLPSAVADRRDRHLQEAEFASACCGGRAIALTVNFRLTISHASI